MAKNLLIVESPAKAKTIENFLGKDFTVKSSFGHVRDLSKKNLGIDTNNNFTPDYVVSTDKTKVVSELKKLASKADVVWLATDEDREGEAIAWHLYEVLGLSKKETKRIVFHEITKSAITNAVKNPRTIDYDLVNAQQARRILDRLVGFEISPILWRKVKPSLSAGRVQSVAVRLIVEREDEIRNFTRQSFFKTTGLFFHQKSKLKASLSKRFDEKEEAISFLEKCKDFEHKVIEVTKKPVKRTPAAPFTTSTLQQEASRKLGFSVSRTMSIAQRLYEAGHITYMRTDSVNLSNSAIESISNLITTELGESYLKVRRYQTKNKSAQEAHEAIRPTYVDKIDVSSDASQNRLYELIRKRTIASQMADAELEKTTVKIDAPSSLVFNAVGEVIKFDGFLNMYLESSDQEEDQEEAGLLPPVNKGDILQVKEIHSLESFTQHPPRFNEASLVRKLEELGIGRPSTYAPTITTIQNREYVIKESKEGTPTPIASVLYNGKQIKEEKKKINIGVEKNKLFPTDIGIVVTEFLMKNFQKIMDYNFTANVEEDFDSIASGKAEWQKTLKEFYTPFHQKVEETAENAENAKGQRLLGVDPQSGKNVYVKIGRFGPMAQIGEAEDEEKPKFASLKKDMTLADASLQEVLDLFKLPLYLGEYEGGTVEVNEGRFGPYVKHNEKFISLGKGVNPLEIDYEQAVQVIKEKQKADAPIAEYENLPVQKGVGRFGPFIKWNNLFINVNKKYDFDNLSEEDIAQLIEEKKRKEKEKFIHNWEAEGISVQKARWGRFNIVKGKTKIELAKDFDVNSLKLKDVEKILSEQLKKKRPSKRKT